MWVLAILVGLGAWSCQPGGVVRNEAPTVIVGQEFSREQMLEDLDFLWSTLEDVHPDLLHNVTETWWLQEQKRITEAVPETGTRLDFFRLAAPTVTALGDGHTGLRLPSEEWAAYLTGGGTTLPFRLGFGDGEVRLLESLMPDAEEFEGKAITAINGMSVDSLRQVMLNFVPGERMAFREMVLARRSLELFWLATGWEGPFEILFEDMEEPIAVPAVTYAEWTQWQATQQQVAQQNGAGTSAMYSYTLWPEANAALFDFRAFSDREAFNAFVEDMFATLRDEGIEHLFIDIRHNGGGNSSLGDDLFLYLTDQPFRQFAQIDVKVSRQIKAQYRNWPALRFRRTGTVMEMEGDMKTPGNNPLRFSGGVYLLTSPYTFSSATSFAAAFKDAEVGLILGEETGGLLRSFGDVYGFWLPNTGLQVGVSHKRFVSPGDDPEGVRPHIYMPWTTLEGPQLKEEILGWLESETGVSYRQRER